MTLLRKYIFPFNAQSSGIRWHFRWKRVSPQLKLTSEATKKHWTIVFNQYTLQQELYQNWCSLSPDRLVTPSIGILTKCTYSVVHSLCFQQARTDVSCQIDLKLQLVLWKRLHVSLWRMRYAKSEQKQMEGAYGNNLCFQTMCCHVNKKVDVSTKQFCMRLKKSKVETIAVLKDFPNFGCFLRSNVNCFAGTTKQMPRWSRKPRQSLDAFWRRSLKPILKKWDERMEACLEANGWYSEKGNVRCMASES